jgi:hypothetical protein
MKGYGRGLIGENTGNGITGFAGPGAKHIEKLINYRIEFTVNQVIVW